MTEFTYVARKPDGSLFRGSLQANDRRAAIAQIEKERGVPIKIEPVGAAPEGKPAATELQGKTKPASADTESADPVTVTRLPIAQLFLFTEQFPENLFPALCQHGLGR